MENLKDLFVPYEIAKKLKEIGFDLGCLARYIYDDRNFEWYLVQIQQSKPASTAFNFDKNIERYDYVAAPTYEQVKLWFMEKHLIFITVNCEKWLSDFKGQVETSDAIIDTEMFHDYNEAFNAAIYAAIPFINKDNN
jgi:hypothetical protein